MQIKVDSTAYTQWTINRFKNELYEYDSETLITKDPPSHVNTRHRIGEDDV